MTNVGGLVGENGQNPNGVPASIETSYSDYAFIISGSISNIGTLVGYNSFGTVDSSYATDGGNIPFIGANGSTASVKNSSVLSYSDSLLQASYVGFDFTNVWTISAGQMPTLR